MKDREINLHVIIAIIRDPSATTAPTNPFRIRTFFRIHERLHSFQIKAVGFGKVNYRKPTENFVAHLS